MRIRLIAAPGEPEAPARCRGCSQGGQIQAKQTYLVGSQSLDASDYLKPVAKGLGFVSVATLLSPSIRLISEA
jgi:hypothetical protein